MYYVFLDESGPPSENELRTCAVIVPQDSYNANVARSTFQIQKDRIGKIDEFLGRISGLGIVCHTKLGDWFKEKTDDSFGDIKRLSRRDNVWSWAMAFAVEAAIIHVEARSNSISTVDIYHDPKALTTDHYEAFRGLLREYLRNRVLREAWKSLGASGLKNVSIRHIVGVPKITSGAQPSEFQRGVWFSDQLMRSECNILGSYSNIEPLDITKYMEEVGARYREEI